MTLVAPTLLVTAVGLPGAAGSEPGAGLVTGAVQFPGCSVPDDLEVCAVPTSGGEPTCTRRLAAGPDGPRFTLELAPGRYHVYARSPSVAPAHRAFFSRAVECGLKATCLDHEPVPVNVRAGRRTTGISPSDWTRPDPLGPPVLAARE